MNRRQLIGWLTVIVGSVLILVSLHSMHEFEKGKEKTSAVKVFFLHNPLWNPLIKFFGGKPQEKLPERSNHAMVTQTIGISLVVVGSVAVYLFRRKKQNYR